MLPKMGPLALQLFLPQIMKHSKNCTLLAVCENTLKSALPCLVMGRRSADRSLNTIEVEEEVGCGKSITHLSTVFLLPVF